MKRESKLALLKGIQEGVLTKEHLHNSKIYIFMGEINDSISENKDKKFKMGGKIYSDLERLEFINRIESEYDRIRRESNPLTKTEEVQLGYNNNEKGRAFQLINSSYFLFHFLFYLKIYLFLLDYL